MSQIIFNSPAPQDVSSGILKSQIENLQTTLASLNQQVIILQEALQERDQEIANLQTKLSECTAVSQTTSGRLINELPRVDETLTIVGALINLYKYIFLPGKAA